MKSQYCNMLAVPQYDEVHPLSSRPGRSLEIEVSFLAGYGQACLFWCHLWQGFLVFLLGRGYFVCPFLCFYDDAPSPFMPVGYFGGVLWRLGTILWHIDGFSTDT